MRGQCSRGIIAAVLTMTILSFSGAARSGEEPRDAVDFRVVERIELACRIGVEKAGTEEEALASLRWRNGALAAIVEIAYQATLSWLSERPDLAVVLENEQGEWLNSLEAMARETRADLESRAQCLHRRLAAFMTITTGKFAPPEQGEFQDNG